MSTENLREIESDFIKFMSGRQNKPEEYIKDIYLKTRSEFKFGTPEFKALTIKVYDLNKLLYDELTEEELIDTYKYHELMSAYRFLSYVYSEEETGGLVTKINTVLTLISNRKFHVLYSMVFKKFKTNQEKSKNSWSPEPQSHKSLAEYLVGKKKGVVSSVVDYGCGPAYVSFEIAKYHKDNGLPIPIVHLVDIDCLMKDFDVYRFNKYDMPVDTISINKNNLYPILPKHDICIATEVMEHVKKPVSAFKNINTSLINGGVLHGNFEDHSSHMLHVSPDLSSLRGELLENNYNAVSRFTYVKKG